MNELISVIVPVYNTGEYLAQCIESLTAQTYRNLEIILVDDGSTDGSGAVCDGFAQVDSRIRVIHQKNAGVSAARNAGLDAMHGEYLLFVDGDDTIAPHTVEAARKAFEADPVDVVLYGVTKIWKAEGRTEELPMETGVFTHREMLLGILKDYASFGAGFPVNKMWRVSAFGSCRDVPRFDPELYFFEDMEWVVRMLLHVGQARLLPEHFYHYYIHSASATHRPGVQERRELGYHRSIEKLLDALAAEPGVHDWFSRKYYPEIVNGVVHAKRHRWAELCSYLAKRLRALRREILNSREVPPKIKFRCRVLFVMQSLGLL